MGIFKEVTAAALIFGSFAISQNALAQGVDVKIGVGIPLSPGQQSTSPGQVYNAARATDPTTALPPGKLYLQNQANDPTTAVPPGQTFTNNGRSKK